MGRVAGFVFGLAWVGVGAQLLAYVAESSASGMGRVVAWQLAAWLAMVGVVVGGFVDPGMRKMQPYPPTTPVTIRERAWSGGAFGLVMAILAIPLTLVVRAVGGPE